MKKFTVEMMTTENYGAYMSGSYDYTVRKEVVEASTKEEAIKFAELHYPNYIINKNYIREVV